MGTERSSACREIIAGGRGGGRTGSEPGLFVVGPLGDRARNRATTQGDVIAELFARAGYRVVAASGRPGSLSRFVEIVRTFARTASWADTLLVQTYSGRAFLIAAAATGLGRLLGQRVILHVHGGSIPELMGRFPRLVDMVMGKADAIVAPSPYLASALGTRGYPVRVIPNCIEVGLYPFRARGELRPRMLWMRSFHDIYNPFMALRVLLGLRERWPEATLTMAGGDKGLESDVRREAAVLGLESAVRFPGFLDFDGKLQEAAQADIFLNTSRVDNTPVGLIEAAALGLPVVTTDVGGIPRLLENGRTGMLVSDNDHQAMTEAVVRLMDEPGLALKLSVEGRALATRFSWEAVRPKWEQLFQTLPRRASSR